jgi:hypothetical protein
VAVFFRDSKSLMPPIALYTHKFGLSPESIHPSKFSQIEGDVGFEIHFLYLSICAGGVNVRPGDIEWQHLSYFISLRYIRGDLLTVDLSK